MAKAKNETKNKVKKRAKNEKEVKGVMTGSWDEPSTRSEREARSARGELVSSPPPPRCGQGTDGVEGNDPGRDTTEACDTILAA